MKGEVKRMKKWQIVILTLIIVFLFVGCGSTDNKASNQEGKTFAGWTGSNGNTPQLEVH